MSYVFSGATAFILFAVFDYFTLTNRGFLKKVFGLTGLAVFIFSSIMTLLYSDTTNIPIVLRAISFVLSLFFLWMLVYSLFLELPFQKTYGNKIHNTKLITTGTYALCRHPGVIWFALFYLFLFLFTAKTMILVGGTVWTILDVIHVIFQEKLFFIVMFPDYGNYINTTPMLIPNLQSYKKCINTIFKTGGIKNDHT